MGKKKKEKILEEVLEEKKEIEKPKRKRRTKEEIENEKKKKEEKVQAKEEEIKKEKPKKETKPKPKSKSKEEGIKIKKYQRTVCEKCDELVDYNIVFGAITETIEETLLTYNALICTCDKCGAILDPLNIYEINQRNLDREYRRINGILQQEEIINLITKSKKTMVEVAHLTGLNDFIISSYMTGLRPLKKNSDIIEEALSTKFKNNG